MKTNHYSELCRQSEVIFNLHVNVQWLYHSFYHKLKVQQENGQPFQSSTQWSQDYKQWNINRKDTKVTQYKGKLVVCGAKGSFMT